MATRLRLLPLCLVFFLIVAVFRGYVYSCTHIMYWRVRVTANLLLFFFNGCWEEDFKNNKVLTCNSQVIFFSTSSLKVSYRRWNDKYLFQLLILHVIYFLLNAKCVTFEYFYDQIPLVSLPVKRTNISDDSSCTGGSYLNVSDQIWFELLANLAHHIKIHLTIC